MLIQQKEWSELIHKLGDALSSFGVRSGMLVAEIREDTFVGQAQNDAAVKKCQKTDGAPETPICTGIRRVVADRDRY